MPKPTLIADRSLTLEQLEENISYLEKTYAAPNGARVYALIQGGGAFADANKVIYESVPPPVTPYEVVLHDFDPGIPEYELLAAVAAIEESEQLLVRRISPAWTENKLRMIAMFDRAAKAIPVVPATPPTPTPPTPAPPPPTVPTASAKYRVVTGKMSHFGGPDDHDVAVDEDTALVFDSASAAKYPGFFLPKTGAYAKFGYGRRLVTTQRYIACRWKYWETPKAFLQNPNSTCVVINPRTGAKVEGVRPIDWGPNETDPHTADRVADLSPAVEQALGIATDDVCTVWIPLPAAGTPAAKPTAQDTSAPAPAAGKVRYVWLTGDYSERQVQAGKENCVLTIDFHFNGYDQPAYGGEIYFKPGSADARRVADEIAKGFAALGLKPHGEWLKSADPAERASYIRHYPCASILLEPLFITESVQAKWIRNEENMQRLSKAVADAVKNFVADKNAVVGLSIGHLGKTSQPSDRGVQGYFNDWEGDYNKRMAESVANLLQT